MDMSVLKIILLTVVLAATALSPGYAETGQALTVEQCIEIALERNQQRRISRLNVEIAEAQLKQALSAGWPQLTFESGLTRLDEDINFFFPQETSTYTISGIVPEPVSAEVTVPAKNIKLVDRDNIMSRIQMVYPLFTGRLIKSLERQGEAGVAAAQQAHRRSEIQLIYDVRRFYYGALLARHLAKMGDEALARLEATVDLTETLYQSGSQSVNKMDYLRSKVFLEGVRSIIMGLHTNVELAHAALGNTIGYAWNQSIVPAEKEIPFTPVDMDLNAIVADGYQFNPDWKQLAAAIEAFDAKVDEEKSHRLPIIGLKGTLWRWDDELDNVGLSTDENREGWSVGVGLKVPIFTGFLTTHKIRAARARLEAMQARRLLLKEGLAIQIKHAFLALADARRVYDISANAGQTAVNLRDLAERAYRNDMTDADTMMESQMMETLTLARAEQARYNHAMALFKLSFLVGREIDHLLE